MDDENGGGSIMIPRWLIHKTYPDVFPFGSKPWELPSIRGAEFRFFYSLHSIPCVGFEVKYGDKRIVFSGDHLNDVVKIKQLHNELFLGYAASQPSVSKVHAESTHNVGDST